ncbi:phage related protein, Gp53 [Methylocystis sp. SC2]|uniref:DUF7666 domain-containing protein n=1 Tax=Methylocystis sp. (strain SC2) TaxID=187303 RepID=UPI00027AF010|nr:phage related protein, Gp53 [Methylocystis sp. SC2]CCJ07056.1 phage related protein, Gp53 [Methylocystis sp. SC2]
MARKSKKTKITAVAPTAPVVVKTVKGFDRDLKCRGFQFEVGKTYSVEGPIVVCQNGWHACENPLDVFRYYPVGVSRFHEVEQSGDLARHDEDTKIASATITIGVELSIGEIVSRAVRWIFDKATVEKESTATSGYRANAATSGYGANAATSGDGANAATSGYGANAATSGDGANAATSGDRANAATSGDRANAATSGYGSNAATSGDGANAATSGDGANAATSGYGSNAATSGKNSVAAALGRRSKAKAGEGGAICLVCRDEDGDILAIRASKVGENGIKAGIWYSLNASGEFVEEAE